MTHEVISYMFICNFFSPRSFFFFLVFTVDIFYILIYVWSHIFLLKHYNEFSLEFSHSINMASNAQSKLVYFSVLTFISSFPIVFGLFFPHFKDMFSSSYWWNILPPASFTYVSAQFYLCNGSLFSYFWW